MKKGSVPKKKKRGRVQKKQGSPAYKLVITSITEANGYGDRFGRVTSPLLGPVLHPDGAVTVLLGDTSDDSRAGKLVLDSFQMDSLATYLTCQADVRRALQDALDEHLAEWDRKRTLGRGKNVWKKVKVEAVGFHTRPPEPPTRAEVAQARAEIRRANPKVSERTLKWLSGEENRRPVPGAMFTLFLHVPLRDGHARLAEFVDGKLAQFVVWG